MNYRNGSASARRKSVICNDIQFTVNKFELSGRTSDLTITIDDSKDLIQSKYCKTNHEFNHLLVFLRLYV